MKYLVLNGPNLDMLGVREPGVYGKGSLKSLHKAVRKHAKRGGFEVDCAQSNHEGELVELIHQARGRYDGIVYNPGAHTHYSYALRDALGGIDVPCVEVHISDVDAREPFRAVSVIAPACVAQVKGRGFQSYLDGLDLLRAGVTERLGEGYEQRATKGQVVVAPASVKKAKASGVSWEQVRGPESRAPEGGRSEEKAAPDDSGEPDGEDFEQCALSANEVLAKLSLPAVLPRFFPGDGVVEGTFQACVTAADGGEGAKPSASFSDVAPVRERECRSECAGEPESASLAEPPDFPQDAEANPALTDPFASQKRLDALRGTFAADDLNAFLVRSTSNIRWLTAFDDVFDEEEAHALLVTPATATLHTDSRYAQAAQDAATAQEKLRDQAGASDAKYAPAEAPVQVDAQPGSHGDFALRRLETLSASERPALAQAPRKRFGRSKHAQAEAPSSAASPSIVLGIEDSLRLSDFRALERAVAQAQNPVRLSETTDVVLHLRAVKSPAEVARLRAAQAITDAAFAHIVEFMRPGLTERAVQVELEGWMLRHGAEGLAFPSIVASGPNGANPHAIAGDTVLEAGTCVVLDFGAKAYGYCSDMTRTVFLGQPDADLKAAYEALVEANETVEAALRAGVTGMAMHQLAESVLAARGFEGRMGHGLGHGVGIDIHELPSLSPRNAQPLVAGNVVTVEPGIYIPGRFGMRLEDFGVVTENGFDVFTRSPHAMTVL